MKLGTKIKAFRIEKNLTLEQLAEMTGSSKGYIWGLENKNPPRPSGEKLMKIARALGTTIEYLLDESGSLDKNDATDQAFFKKYQKLPPKTKAKIRKYFNNLLDIIN